MVAGLTTLGLRGEGPGRWQPSAVKEGVTKAEAEEMKKKLEDQGAVVELATAEGLSRALARDPPEDPYFGETHDG